MIKQLKFFCFAVAIAIIASSGSLTAKSNTLEQPVSGKNGMVSTQEAIASRVGVEILKQGGNAIDAAVAVGFALAVTYPRAGNLGGGGFMLIYKANDELATAIDYREMAPKAAFRDMFLDEKGNVDNQKARFSALSSGIPGTVAGLVYALEKYGSMNLKQVIKPALDLASNGFIVPDELYRSFKKAQSRLSVIAPTREVYYPDNGEPRAAGKLFQQPELASVLLAIHDKGRAGFYNGAFAKLISDDSLNNGGIITLEDLASYQPAERQPVMGTYRSHKVISMPPPSSGGIHLIQMLNVLENWDIKASKLNTASTVNRMVETMKRAYSDRSKHLGDPGFYDVPVAQLTDKRYAKALFEAIEAKQVTPSVEIN
ncbi:MAG: gamma-glutamyltransferase, partial [Enterobacterales bacterium]|nr:gamma-glutamyltransferase [Enterobacterales bacterium]